MQLHRLIEQDSPPTVEYGFPAMRRKKNDVGFGTGISYLLYRTKDLRVTGFGVYGNDQGVSAPCAGRADQRRAPPLEHCVRGRGIERDLNQCDVLRNRCQFVRTLTIDVEHDRQRDLRLRECRGQEIGVGEGIAASD